MARIKAGYRLHVVDGAGVLQGTIALKGYDLDEAGEVWQLAGDVVVTLPAEAFESESKTEEG